MSTAEGSATSVVDPSTFFDALSYKPGWTFKIAGPGNRYLCIFATTTDSADHTRVRCTQHQFELPTGPQTFQSWARWTFAQLLRAERHETAEFFTIGARRPFFPNHQDEGSPYEHVERWE